MKQNNIIYIYETPESKKQNLIKIGDALDPDKRIKEQLNTAAVISEDQLKYTLLHTTDAITISNKDFRDHQIHEILKQKGYEKHSISNEDKNLSKSSTEWFKIDLDQAIHLIEEYKKDIPPEQINIDRFNTFSMNPSQENAVTQTEEYFSKAKTFPSNFLWNAKMRFGKTFTAYQLVKKMNLKKVLILTYKPAVEDAWNKDLNHHIDFENYVFLTKENLTKINSYEYVVAFASYQDLLGEETDNTIKEKHKQLFNTNWDILIIDEFHYGTNTERANELLDKKELKELLPEDDEEIIEEQESEEITELAEKNISSKYRLYLSGTPFKAIQNDKFESDAIFNWTYVDEQKAKEDWNINNDPETNPYKNLPRIEMYLYKVSEDLIKAGTKEDKDEFSLNYFFKATKNKFDNEEAVKQWLDLISGRIKPAKSIEDELDDSYIPASAKYPYDIDHDLHTEINHTLWYFHRSNSAIAMANLLKVHPIFEKYHIELVTGGKTKSGLEALPPVLKAIDENEKTITITVGKLTTGVSVPEWKAVFFLRDTTSPEDYFQTAFRAQTPFKDKKTGKIKEACYIFDFSPNRSLKLLTTYSEKLSVDNHITTSEEKIEEFIRYLPVLKVYGNEMVYMDARDVLVYDLTGVDAVGLGQRFSDRKNIVVNSDILDLIFANPEHQSQCASIFEKIKHFKRFNGETDTKNYDVDMISLDKNNQKIKDLKTKAKSKTDSVEKDEEDKDLEKAKKDQKSEAEKLRELLKTLLQRLPIFMYLTDATEENLEQVLIEPKLDLFRKTTGINTDEFRFLVKMGLIKIDSIDGYILRFVQLENKNFEVNNKLIK